MTIKCSLGAVIENKIGQRFRCNGFGKGWVNGEYTDMYNWIQFNTEDIPITFRISLQQYQDAIEKKKMIRLN